jgi:hypothetical protein
MDMAQVVKNVVVRGSLCFDDIELERVDNALDDVAGGHAAFSNLHLVF